MKSRWAVQLSGVTGVSPSSVSAHTCGRASLDWQGEPPSRDSGWAVVDFYIFQLSLVQVADFKARRKSGRRRRRGRRRPLSRHLWANTRDLTTVHKWPRQILTLAHETTLVPETDRPEEPVRYCFWVATNRWHE